VRVIIRWRFVAASAILAMALSFLIGGMRGIRLGNLMIRASIGAAVFTVLAIGINLLVVNLFPELFDVTKSEDNKYSDNDEPLGSLVDITLPSKTKMAGANSDYLSTAAQADEGIPPENKPGLFSDSIPDVDSVRSKTHDNESSVSDGERDPKELARAIHTVITRDEKG